MSPDLAERLRRHLERSGLFPEPGLALLAVSGGGDSVALAFLLADLAPELDLDLAVGHVDHGIQRGSADVAREVERLAGRLGLPFHLERLRLGAGTSETEARRARYRALRDMQRGIDARYLVTAHHADDQVETVLHRFLKGTGLAGLAGIPARGPRGLVRPLLPFGRRELARWLERRTAAQGEVVRVHDDPANADQRHDRSWLRARLLPFVADRYGAAAREAVLDVGRHAARDRAAWAALLTTLDDLEYRRRGAVVELARHPLATYDKTLCEAILRAAAREVGCVVGPRRAHRLRRFLTEGTSGRVLQLGRGWEAELAFDRMRILPAAQDETVREPVHLGAAAEGCARWGEWDVVWTAERAGSVERQSFTTWVTPGVVAVRTPRGRDRMHPVGGVGGRKVRRLLMEARVPFRERARYPVLVRDRDVLWLPGICRSQAALPRPGEPAMRIEARVRERK
ncbi:MAG: tRNA lysidine(34) synthetase TilS [Gemmatimonadales bacterium]